MECRGDPQSVVVPFPKTPKRGTSAKVPDGLEVDLGVNTTYDIVQLPPNRGGVYAHYSSLLEWFPGFALDVL